MPGYFGKTTPSGSQGTNYLYLVASKVFMPEPGTVWALSSYSYGGGQTRLGLYTDIYGIPGTKILETAWQASVPGWNYLKTPNVYLPGGYFWIAIQINGSGSYQYEITSDYESYAGTYFVTVPPLPNDISGMSRQKVRYTTQALYCPGIASATVTPITSTTPTNTPSPVNTDTPTPTPHVPVTIIGSWGTGNNSFWGPTGLAIDPSNNLYVADGFNYRIKKIDSNGTYLSQIALPFLPNDVTLDGSGNIYISDYDGNKIVKYNSAGVSITQWGTAGTGNGQFNAPAGMAVHGATIYVSDTGNDRVQAFDLTGNYLFQFGSSGMGDGQFSYSTDLDTDSAGNVYTIDCSKVQKFSPTGSFLAKWTDSAALPFGCLLGIHLDASDNIWITDYSDDQVLKFTQAGVLLARFGETGTCPGCFDWPDGIVTDSSGYLYIVDHNNDRIQKFAP